MKMIKMSNKKLLKKAVAKKASVKNLHKLLNKLKSKKN